MAQYTEVFVGSDSKIRKLQDEVESLRGVVNFQMFLWTVLIAGGATAYAIAAIVNKW